MKDFSLPQKILLFLEENGMVLHETLYHPSRMAYHYLETRDRIGRQAFYNAIQRMKKQKLLQKKRQNGATKFTITEKGRLKIFGLNTKPDQWDGKWRIVIFDIPETKRDLRNFFRGKLQELGYRFLQESVWICPYNIADKVEDLIAMCKVGQYIHYLVVEELDNNNVLMKLFNLKGRKYGEFLTKYNQIKTTDRK
ncbi:MAG: Transcriptional regulator, PaaX [Candidatus Berkelbacteria bacterium]|nr:Transcriptional regulator, PaaX [Candidatus Berkelbacteria bacterium]